MTASSSTASFELDNGIRVLGASGVAVENLTVQNYATNGIFWTGVDGFRGSYLTAIRNQAYGIYAFDSRHGLIEHSYAAGSADGGVYVGQCYPCDTVVDDVISEHNGMGFSDANAGGNLLVVNSTFRRNRIGVALGSHTYELCYPQREATIVGNLISSNNEADTGAMGPARLAMGNGVVVGGGIGNRIERNRVWDHDRTGIAVVPNPEDTPTDDMPSRDEWALTCAESRELPIADPLPALNFWEPYDNQVVGNVLADNRDVDIAVASPNGDLPTFGNCASANEYAVTAPAALEVLAPCDAAAGDGDWADGAYDVVAWLTEFDSMPEPVPYTDVELPPLPDLDELPDAATAPAAPAVDMPPAVDVDGDRRAATAGLGPRGAEAGRHQRGGDERPSGGERRAGADSVTVVEPGRRDRRDPAPDRRRRHQQRQAAGGAPGDEVAGDRDRADDRELEAPDEDGDGDHAGQRPVVHREQAGGGDGHDERAADDAALLAPSVGAPLDRDDAPSSIAPSPNVAAASTPSLTSKSSLSQAPNVTNSASEAHTRATTPTTANQPARGSRVAVAATEVSTGTGAGRTAAGLSSTRRHVTTATTAATLAPTVYAHRHDDSAVTTPSALTPTSRPSAQAVSTRPTTLPRRSNGTWSTIHAPAPTTSTIPNEVIIASPTVNHTRPELAAATNPPTEQPASPQAMAARRLIRSTSRPISGAANPVDPVIVSATPSSVTVTSSPRATTAMNGPTKRYRACPQSRATAIVVTSRRIASG